MMETELTVLKSSIAKQKKNLEALHNSADLESKGNASFIKMKSGTEPQEAEYYKQEIQRCTFFVSLSLTAFV